MRVDFHSVSCSEKIKYQNAKLMNSLLILTPISQIWLKRNKNKHLR